MGSMTDHQSRRGGDYVFMGSSRALKSARWGLGLRPDSVWARGEELYVGRESLNYGERHVAATFRCEYNISRIPPSTVE